MGGLRAIKIIQVFLEPIVNEVRQSWFVLKNRQKYLISSLDFPLHSELIHKVLKMALGAPPVWLPALLLSTSPSPVLAIHPGLLAVLGHSTQVPISGLGSLQPLLRLETFPRPPDLCSPFFSEGSPILPLNISSHTPSPSPVPQHFLGQCPHKGRDFIVHCWVVHVLE